MPTFIDLFCGAGGLSLGLILAGLEVLYAVDNDRDAVESYNHNVARVAEERDVRSVTPGHIMQKCHGRRPDVVAGGPPCQGFSLQNRHHRQDDPRNDLLQTFLSVVRGLRPKAFIMENVSALSSKRGKRNLDAFCRRLNSMYDIKIEKLNAADYGVPQTRNRIIVVGTKKGSREQFHFPIKTHSIEDYVSVRQALRGLPEPSRSHMPNHVVGNMSALNRLRFSFVPQGGGWKDVPLSLRYKAHKGKVAESCNWPDVLGRLSWHLPAPTITSGFTSITKGRFGHPKQDRALTPREAARLQTFKDEFVFHGSKSSVCKQIGNAVPVKLAKALGKSIMRAIV